MDIADNKNKKNLYIIIFALIVFVQCLFITYIFATQKQKTLEYMQAKRQ